MKPFWMDRHEIAGTVVPADAYLALRLAEAAAGDPAAYFDLGVALSTGSHGLRQDLVEAHKWFNIAASLGHAESGLCRADLAEEMSASEIAEAQRRARRWLNVRLAKAA